MTEANHPTVRQRLRARLNSGPLLVAPGIYDAYGARFVEQAGFEAVYMTGNTKAVRGRMLNMQEYSAALNLADVEEWEKKYLQSR